MEPLLHLAFTLAHGSLASGVAMIRPIPLTIGSRIALTESF
jgi:uncharacterized membrane protein